MPELDSTMRRDFNFLMHSRWSERDRGDHNQPEKRSVESDVNLGGVQDGSKHFAAQIMSPPLRIAARKEDRCAESGVACRAGCPPPITDEVKQMNAHNLPVQGG